MTSGPITSWKIEWETVETVADFILWSFKVTAVGDPAMKLKEAYSLEGKFDQPRQHYSKAETLLCQQRSV